MKPVKLERLVFQTNLFFFHSLAHGPRGTLLSHQIGNKQLVTILATNIAGISFNVAASIKSTFIFRNCGDTMILLIQQ